MSLDRLKEIINEKYFAVFKSICSDEKEIASAGENAKSMDDVIKLDPKLVSHYIWCPLDTIIELWTKVKASSCFDEIIDSLLQNHFLSINHYPGPSKYSGYITDVGDAALSCLNKGVEQSIVTGDLKQKVEAGILANYKKRKMHSDTPPIEIIPASKMFPWSKLESKTIEDLSLSKIKLGTCVSATVKISSPEVEKPKSSSSFFQPKMEDKSIQISTLIDKKQSKFSLD